MDQFEFNSTPSRVMHVDLNSCFATIEQQANPLLRGKPIVVAAYKSPGGCILAPSIEAKTYGVKTGMRVKDGKKLCPDLIVRGSDPDKYRFVHIKLRDIFSSYTDRFFPKSIDEFVLEMDPTSPRLRRVGGHGMRNIALDIKKRIKREIGEWLTVSVGISTNRFLAKQASNLRKPDGLDEINYKNYLEIYEKWKLTDLCGIARKNALRLRLVGINNVVEFYEAPLWKLRAAFRSINSYFWFMRLRGWEVDGVEFQRRTFGNSYALPEPFVSEDELSPILAKLVHKTGIRLRKNEYGARGVHLGIRYRENFGFWHKGKSFPEILYGDDEIFERIFNLLKMSECKFPVRELYVTVFDLVSSEIIQGQVFRDVKKARKLTDAIDEINNKWGLFSVHSARMITARELIPDRIGFGRAA